jgi:protein SCO1/2
MRTLSKKKLFIGSLLWLSLITIVFAIPFIPYDSRRGVHVDFLDKKASDRAFVFFGFATCPDVCPSTLSTLKNILDQKNLTQNLPQVAFVDIDVDSNSTIAQSYAKQFYQDFIGYYPQPQELAQLVAAFGLNIKKQGDALQHAGRTYLLEKESGQWWLVKTFNPQTVSEKTLLQALNR